MWAKLWALLRLRCPRCRRGQLFRGRFAMNDPCPVCGLVFQREQGYFLGAMYVSFPIGLVLLGGLYGLGLWLWPHWHPALVTLVMFFVYLPLTPAVFRYSRAVWIYLDRWASPTDTSESGAWQAYRFRGP